MKNQIYYFLLLFIIGCSNDNTIEQTKIESSKNKIELKVNGVNTTENIVEINSFFMCSSDIEVTVITKKNNITENLIVFNISKDGNLKSIKFNDKSQDYNQIYYSPDFIPSSTISISDFEFSENNFLKFKFSGEVFKRKNSFFEVNETKQIDGFVEIKKFSTSFCNTFQNFIILNNDIKFSNVTRTNQNIQQNQIVNYEGNSLNGFNINIRNLNQNITEMPLGTYSFSNMAQTEKIEFRKYIGSPKSFSTSYLIPSDWQIYDTEGSFTIIEKTIINGIVVAKIKLNFTASVNGIIEYTFTDSEFQTAY